MNLRKVKEIYVVSGGRNSGKTTILTQLCKHLQMNVPASDSDCINLTSQDKCIKVRWHDGRIIGVGTAGDTADCVLENFLNFSDGGSLFPDVGCDVVAIALTTCQNRSQMRYKPNFSSAYLELYDVLIPGFMPTLAVSPTVVPTHYIHGNCKNCQQLRTAAVSAAVQQLRTLMNV